MYDVFYSVNSHQHVSAATAVIFRVMLLLQEYKCTNVVSCVDVTPYLLTYSMVQSPCWEANWFAASQEIPRISRNPKVHYRTHKRPPTVSILGQPNPVHIATHPTSCRSILILSTHLRLGLPSDLFPSGFHIKTLYTPLSSPIRATGRHSITIKIIFNLINNNNF